jgi:type II secretory pathway pseudopilin PulG
MGLLLGLGLVYAQQEQQQQAPQQEQQQQQNQQQAQQQQQQQGLIDYGEVEDEAALGQGTLEQSLYLLTVENFEQAGEWRAAMPLEYGLVNLKEIQGAPLELAQKGAEQVKVPPKYGNQPGGQKTYFEEKTDEHKQILGTKVSFMQRGHSWVRINPPFPINLEGLVKGFSLWVCGRNKRHHLYFVVEDFYGDEKLLDVGELNFMGWKKISMQVPYTIVQEDFRYSFNRGLTFKGFLIRFHPMETSGRYYVYFDNLSTELSRFLEENRDKDNPLDTW